MTFPIVLLLAGLVLLLIGLLGRIKIKDFEAGTDSKPIRVAAFSFGMALLLAAFLVYQSDRPHSPDNSNVPNISTPSAPPPSSSTPTPTGSPISTPTLPKPDMLIEIIVKVQHNNVKESYGERAGQNFSDQDLENFEKKGERAKITAQLKTDGEFLDVVLAIKHMTASERQKLLSLGLNKYKPTWEQLGRVDKEGQTDAGQKAERMIAEDIVNLVKQLLTLSDEKIKKLQEQG